MNRALGMLLICLTAVPAIGALSEKYKEWGEGPAQWIMTPEEQRAWRKVAADEEAVQFIDLFWARRDPTSGTAVNEYWNDFESRVIHADAQFSEKRKRGAMTDRGRVYIVLGNGTTMEGMIGQNYAQMAASDAASDSNNFIQAGLTYTWTWEHADARKFDMPRIIVGFVEDPITRKVTRDPRKPDFLRAAPKAIRLAIANPDLTVLPDWAATGGLERVMRVTREEIIFPARGAAPAPVPVPESVETPRDEGPAVASSTPGVSRLTLGRSGETTFKAGRNVPWDVQFCSAKAEVPRLKYMLFVAGPTEQRTREMEGKPERIPSQPGCYVLKGMMPAAKLAPGAYKLTVYIDDVATGESHKVKGAFRIE